MIGAVSESAAPVIFEADSVQAQLKEANADAASRVSLGGRNPGQASTLYRELVRTHAEKEGRVEAECGELQAAKRKLTLR